MPVSDITQNPVGNALGQFGHMASNTAGKVGKTVYNAGAWTANIAANAALGPALDMWRYYRADTKAKKAAIWGPHYQDMFQRYPNAQGKAYKKGDSLSFPGWINFAAGFTERVIGQLGALALITSLLGYGFAAIPASAPLGALLHVISGWMGYAATFYSFIAAALRLILVGHDWAAYANGDQRYKAGSNLTQNVIAVIGNIVGAQLGGGINALRNVPKTGLVTGLSTQLGQAGRKQALKVIRNNLKGAASGIGGAAGTAGAQSIAPGASMDNKNAVKPARDPDATAAPGVANPLGPQLDTILAMAKMRKASIPTELAGKQQQVAALGQAGGKLGEVTAKEKNNSQSPDDLKSKIDEADQKMKENPKGKVDSKEDVKRGEKATTEADANMDKEPKNIQEALEMAQRGKDIAAKAQNQPKKKRSWWSRFKSWFRRLWAKFVSFFAKVGAMFAKVKTKVMGVVMSLTGMGSLGADMQKTQQVDLAKAKHEESGLQTENTIMDKVIEGVKKTKEQQ